MSLLTTQDIFMTYTDDDAKECLHRALRLSFKLSKGQGKRLTNRLMANLFLSGLATHLTPEEMVVWSGVTNEDFALEVVNLHETVLVTNRLQNRRVLVNRAEVGRKITRLQEAFGDAGSLRRRFYASKD